MRKNRRRENGKIGTEDRLEEEKEEKNRRGRRGEKRR